MQLKENRNENRTHEKVNENAESVETGNAGYRKRRKEEEVTTQKVWKQKIQATGSEVRRRRR